MAESTGISYPQFHPFHTISLRVGPPIRPSGRPNDPSARYRQFIPLLELALGLVYSWSD